MTRSLLLVGLGSCIGGISRYLSQLLVQKHYPSSFPFGTLSVNITGCFFVGIIYALADRGNIMSPATRLLLATGFCGGFTTFSSFAFENISLLRDGEFLYTSMYILLSVVFGLVAVYLGILLIKSI
jgi:fluoride exporter